MIFAHIAIVEMHSKMDNTIEWSDSDDSNTEKANPNISKKSTNENNQEKCDISITRQHSFSSSTNISVLSSSESTGSSLCSLGCI